MLLEEADSIGVVVKEKPLQYNDGRQFGKRIAIRKDIDTTIEKGCVLAEELGHYYTTVGDILDQTNVSNRKQEYRARLWGYNKIIGLSGIISCYKARCNDMDSMADHLDITVEYLKEALDCYKQKYGLYTQCDNYVIFFEPALAVLELI